jgi:hypothetical protein
VRHRREARTGEHREYANQSAFGYLWKYFNHEKGRKQAGPRIGRTGRGELGVGCSDWLDLLRGKHIRDGRQVSHGDKRSLQKVINVKQRCR